MSLFGSTTQTAQTPSTGLFGTNQNAAPSAGSVFGSAFKPSTTPSLGGGLFGSGATQSAQAGGNQSGFGAGTASNLFGSSLNANANGGQTQSAGGLFGSAATNQSTSGGLFGNSNANNTAGSNPSNGGSLFGATANQQQPVTGASLFGGAQQANGQSAPSLFGSALGASVSSQSENMQDRQDRQANRFLRMLTSLLYSELRLQPMFSRASNNLLSN
jgi:hypothetical protein